MRYLISILSVFFIISCSNPEDSYIGFWVPYTEYRNDSPKILITKDENNQFQIITSKNKNSNDYAEFNDGKLFLVGEYGFPKIEIIKINDNKIQIRGTYYDKYFINCADLKKKIDNLDSEIYKKVRNSDEQSIKDSDKIFEEIITKLSPSANKIESSKERLYFLNNSNGEYYSSKKEFYNEIEQSDQLLKFAYFDAIDFWLRNYPSKVDLYQSYLEKINHDSCDIYESLNRKIYE